VSEADDLWSDEIEAFIDAAFATVSRNPSDHETAVAWRLAILYALRAQPSNEAELPTISYEKGSDNG
jgi:hypothetical protein